MAKTGFGRSSNDLNSSLLDDSEIGNDKFTDSLIESSSSSFNVDDIANSASLSMFLLLNAMIGSGILNQPYVFSQSGLIGGVAAFIVAAFFTWGGLMLLTETGISRGVLEYSGLTKKVFGKIGEQAVDFFIVIQAFGSQVGYILVVGQTTTELLNGWGCENAICGQYSTTIGTTILFVTPVCLLRHLGHLAILSLFSILAIVLCMALVVIGGPVTTKNDEKSDVVIFDVIGMLGSAGSIVFALSCAPANFQAFVSTEKKSQNVPTWTWVTGGAVILGAIMCMIMGICGYLSFRDTTDGEILNNFPQRGFDFFKLMIVIHLILYIPVNFIIMRYSLVRMWCDKKSEDLMAWSHITVTLFLIAFITGIVLILIAIGFANGKGFSIILTLTGGVAGSSLTFIAPAALYLREKPGAGRWTVMAWACGLFGFAVMITVVTITFIQFT